MKEKPIYEQLGYDPDPPFYAPTSKPIVTNYDRLVNKSPEELAEWLTNFSSSNAKPYATARGEMYRGRLLDWLKQEGE